MAVFDCQKIPFSLFDYALFKERHKGSDDKAIIEAAANEDENITLPQIVYTTHTISLYSPISKLTERERSAVALGFEAADYKDENEIVWIAVEIDSKLEADADLTAFWCDRLEMVAFMCDFSNYRLWLVAPEGFSPEALKILSDRNGIGSSRKQVTLLAKQLDAENIIDHEVNPNESQPMPLRRLHVVIHFSLKRSIRSRPPWSKPV